MEYTYKIFIIRRLPVLKKSSLSIIENYIETCANALKSREQDSEKTFTNYQNLKIVEKDLESYLQILQKNFQF